MSKNNKIIAGICGAVVAIAAIVAVVVVVINNNNNNDGDSGSSSSETRSNPIVGRWKYTDSELGDLGIDFVYTFNADGTGNYDMSGTKLEFTYTTSGSTLTINYTESGTFETEYEIKDNVLNVKDSGGSDTLYKKI